MLLITIFAVLVFGFSLISRKLETTAITPPIVFTAAGIMLVMLSPAEVDTRVRSHLLLHLAEIGLALLLFSDAARTDLSVLWRIRNLPARLLGIGLPLTIMFGTVAGWLLFPELRFWEVAILAAILAPTDAGLGQLIVASPRVPLRIREALNVEAGLNDGLSVPFLLFFMALTSVAVDGPHAGFEQFIVEQLGYGAAIGAAIGIAGGLLLNAATRREWISDPFKQAGVVALPVLCIVVSETVSASMFIAAFVAGLTVQKGYRDAGRHSGEFGEIWGQILNLAVFFLFGLVVARSWHEIDLRIMAYAAVSLTVVRMAPVAISLMGMRLHRSTLLFLGWFGPRGLASIVLGLIYLEEELHLPGESTIKLATITTVLLSILAHGLSARPGIELYARQVDRLDAKSPERS